MTSKRSVTVRVFDQNLVINTDASDEEVQKVARYVNEQVGQILSKTKNISPLNAAILAALNTAEKYFECVAQQEELKREVTEKSKRILGLLDIPNQPSS